MNENSNYIFHPRDSTRRILRYDEYFKNISEIKTKKLITLKWNGSCDQAFVQKYQKLYKKIAKTPIYLRKVIIKNKKNTKPAKSVIALPEFAKMHFSFVKIHIELNLDDTSNVIKLLQQKDNFFLLNFLRKTNSFKLKFRKKEKNLELLQKIIDYISKFKSLKEIILDFEGSQGIGEQAVKIVSSGFQYLKKLENLTINLNTNWKENKDNDCITNSAIIVLSRAVSILSEIRFCDICLSNCWVRDEGSEALCKAFQQFPHLQSLKMSIKDTFISEKGLKLLADNIRLKKNLKYLHMTFESIPSAARYFYSKLAQIRSLKSLTIVPSYKSHNLKMHVYDTLEQKEFKTITSFHLEENNFTDDRAEQIAKALLAFTTLEVFKLSLFNERSSLSLNGYENIMKSINSLENLKELTIDIFEFNKNVSKKDTEYVFNVLKNLPNLKRFCLCFLGSSLFINDKNLKIFCDNAYCAKSLRTFKLELEIVERITVIGSQLLSNGIKKLSRLEELSIKFVNKFPQSDLFDPTGLFNSLTYLNHLIGLTLRISGFNLTSQNIFENLLLSFSKLHKLTDLNLDFSIEKMFSPMLIDKKNTETLAKAIGKLKKLNKLNLNLSGLKIGDYGFYVILRTISDISGIKTLKLILNRCSLSESILVKNVKFFLAMDNLKNFDIHLSGNEKIQSCSKLLLINYLNILQKERNLVHFKIYDENEDAINSY